MSWAPSSSTNGPPVAVSPHFLTYIFVVDFYGQTYGCACHYTQLIHYFDDGRCGVQLRTRICMSRMMELIFTPLRHSFTRMAMLYSPYLWETPLNSPFASSEILLNDPGNIWLGKMVIGTFSFSAARGAISSYDKLSPSGS